MVFSQIIAGGGIHLVSAYGLHPTGNGQLSDGHIGGSQHEVRPLQLIRALLTKCLQHRSALALLFQTHFAVAHQHHISLAAVE